jgi:dTDP-4-dehydrorhamnose reductase
MKTLIIGSNGQLGCDLTEVFSADEIVPLTHDDIDIADMERSRKVLESHHPGVVINTAAYHNVPECERHPETAFLVNSVGLKNLSEICHDHRITLVHISTDYVFDGKKNTPYNESDIPDPLNTYGVSKLAGEYFVRRVENHYVIRLASLFGKAGCRAKGGGNFVKTMLHMARTKDKVQVTSNIICSPTFTRDAAAKIKELLSRNYPSGIYHAANGGSCSWYEFALEIFSLAKIKIDVEPRTEDEIEGGVRRPLYSPLTSEKIKPGRNWKDALKAYLIEENVL